MAESHPKFDVALVTPDGAAFDGEAEMVIVPGAAGEIGVLARHAPLVATLKAGSTRIHLSPNEVLEFATGPGFFKVELDRALALVDDAVSVKEIDDDRARGQLEAAKAELEKVEAGESTADRWQLEQRIKHAENQLFRVDAGRAPTGLTRRCALGRERFSPTSTATRRRSRRCWRRSSGSVPTSWCSAATSRGDRCRRRRSRSCGDGDSGALRPRKRGRTPSASDYRAAAAMDGGAAHGRATSRFSAASKQPWMVDVERLGRDLLRHGSPRSDEECVTRANAGRTGP